MEDRKLVALKPQNYTSRVRVFSVRPAVIFFASSLLVAPIAEAEPLGGATLAILAQPAPSEPSAPEAGGSRDPAAQAEQDDGLWAEPVSAAPEEKEDGLEGRVLLGFALPTIGQKITETYNPGVGIGGELGLALGRFHVGLMLGYSHLFFNSSSALSQLDLQDIDPTVLQGVDLDGGGLSLIEMMASARFDLFTAAQIEPYVLLSGGAVWLDPNGLTLTRTEGDQKTSIHTNPDSQFRPALGAGFGATEQSGPVDLFAQLRLDLFFEDEVLPVAMVQVGAGF